jgi:multidrug resistance protein, MATE family
VIDDPKVPQNTRLKEAPQLDPLDTVSGQRAGSGSVLAEFKQLWPLALPLAAVQLGENLLGAVDIAVVGRLGKVELGATGLGNALFFGTAIFGIGLMRGLDPLISQAVGAKEHRSAQNLFWQGVWLSLIVSIPLCFVVWFLAQNLTLFGIDAVIADQSIAYVSGRLPAMIPLLVFTGSRCYLQAFEITRPMLIGVVLANLLNLPLSWLLVFGDAGLMGFGLPAMGVPALGVMGAGLTSTFCTVFQCVFLLWYIRRHIARQSGLKSVSFWPKAQMMIRASRIGVPLGLTFLSEVAVFAIVGILMGNLSPDSLAGHQVALTLASASFMVPLGIGTAASVRVGRAIGRGDSAGARLAGFVSIGTGVLFMAVMATIFMGAPEALIKLITDQPDAIAAATPLIFIAAVFQLSDGIQAVTAGALRGTGDTKWPLALYLAAFYLFGLPVGCLLAFPLGYGAEGLWWGLSLGLTVVAVSLVGRFWILSKRALKRV